MDLSKATFHGYVRENGRVVLVPSPPEKAENVGFIMLKDGRIHFEGTAAELLASADPYVKKFLAGLVLSEESPSGKQPNAAPASVSTTTSTSPR